jgi:hypothetical protein
MISKIINLFVLKLLLTSHCNGFLYSGVGEGKSIGRVGRARQMFHVRGIVLADIKHAQY